MLVIVLASWSARSVWAQAQYDSPDWYMILTDAGYSDFIIDNKGAFPPDTLHELISGEWAAAVGYDAMSAEALSREPALARAAAEARDAVAAAARCRGIFLPEEAREGRV
ncbi:MAG TPA: hypothetical protein VJS92_03085 [Candidatus Polarisedimenticolaceae bacterium]|nr:hypothetical protein [Candidatus Polarisedimenticolaceae bacterium]